MLKLNALKTKSEDSLKMNEYESEAESYYILNLKDKAQLQNGF